MEVILKTFVNKLGDKDELVKVRDGYALNFLIPKGYAIPATPSQKKVREENLRQAAHRQEKVKTEALVLAEKIKTVSISLPALMGKDGKMYGSITPLQLANELKKAGLDIDRKRIEIADEVLGAGAYTATVTLHKEVKLQLPFSVVAQSTE
jgi:large subunit ribosomal protein L9